MSQFKLMFIPMVALIFVAGLVVGRLSTRVPAASSPQGQERSPSWLHDQLALSADQRKQMDAIWNPLKQDRSGFDRYRTLGKERDQAVQALLTPEQKSQYDGISESYRTKRTELDKERETRINDANEKSRALLDDSQKKRWDELTKERDRRGPRGNRGPGGPGGPDRGPSGQDRGPGGPEWGPSTSQRSTTRPSTNVEVTRPGPTTQTP